MKKTRTIIGSILLTVVLTGNTFATEPVSGFFTHIAGQIAVMIASITSEDCDSKICQTCKPNQPTCRPIGSGN